MSSAQAEKDGLIEWSFTLSDADSRPSYDAAGHTSTSKFVQEMAAFYTTVLYYIIIISVYSYVMFYRDTV